MPTFEAVASDPLARELTPKRLREMVRVASSRLASITVVVENVKKPHNASAILRSAEAIGLSTAHIIEEPIPFRPTRGITKGAQRWIQVVRHARLELCLAELHQAGFTTWAADVAPGTVRLDDIPVETPVAIVLGSELHGLSDRARQLTRGQFRIPMAGFTESLNVSVCAALALYTLAQRRRLHLGAEGDLTESQCTELVRSWVRDTRRRRERGRVRLSKTDHQP